MSESLTTELFGMLLSSMSWALAQISDLQGVKVTP